jgi:hypothetical protein
MVFKDKYAANTLFLACGSCVDALNDILKKHRLLNEAFMGEKKDLERAAVVEFSKLFTANANRGTLELIELLDPPAPDTRCRFAQKDLFIEVAHVYGTEADAKKRLGREKVSAGNRPLSIGDAAVPFDIRVIQRLNHLLQKKSAKMYSGSPIWLLVRSAFPLMDLEDFMSYSDSIVVPANHPFAEIWLLCGSSAKDGAIKLV